MAVLSHVGYEHDQFISSYSSDPVLKFGATRVWHGIHETALTETILPQFRKMLHQELMDTGGAGEMVAWIVLLLSMDACGVLETGKESSRWSRAGEFTSVWTFLKTLHGPDPKLKHIESKVNQPPRKEGNHFECTESTEEESRAAMKAIEADWNDWCVSFTHFVQLTEHPSEDCLWAMLARRAAGAFARGRKGVDLVIPICSAASLGTDGKTREPRVSMNLVQVKNRQTKDPEFPESATKGMRPSVIFQRGKCEVSIEKKAFQELGPESVVRVYMSFRDTDSECFYLQDDIPNRPPTYVLCTQGLSERFSRPDPNTLASWESRRDPEANDGLVQVVSRDLATQLQEMLCPWWEVPTMVKEDLRAREDAKCFGLSVDAVVNNANLPLPQTLVFNGKKRSERKSRLGRCAKSPTGGHDRDEGMTLPTAASDATIPALAAGAHDGDANMVDDELIVNEEESDHESLSLSSSS